MRTPGRARLPLRPRRPASRLAVAVKWIVLALVLSALVLLVAVVRPVLRRLPQLQRAVMTLRRQQAAVESLKAHAMTLDPQLARLQGQAQTAAQRVAVIQAKRHG